MVSIGIISVQGDFLEHTQLLNEIPGVSTISIKSSDDLSKVDALIIPGGESTTIGGLLRLKHLDLDIKKFAESGRPLMGICAGSVLMAKKVIDRVVGEVDQPILNLMNIKVLRNAFGRQRESFQTEIFVEGIGDVKAVFIRGPAILEVWGNAKLIGFVDHPKIGRVGTVAIERNMIAIAFHPELVGDTRFYKYLITEARR